VKNDRPFSDQRASIEAALPDGVTMTEEAWADLTEVVDGYRKFEHRRTTYPLKKERARWKRLGDALTKGFPAELRQYQDMLRSDPNPMLWRNRALAALGEIHRQVEMRAAFHNIWSAFGGSKNPDREFLYRGILRVWTDRLGGKLRYSIPYRGASKSKRLPSGPLVRFFTACVEPVLGDETPRAGVADIIERERADRARVEAEKRRRSGL
jgi:hypothetical protein